jgi:hypothetical protein
MPALGVLALQSPKGDPHNSTYTASGMRLEASAPEILLRSTPLPAGNGQARKWTWVPETTEPHAGYTTTASNKGILSRHGGISHGECRGI